MTPLGVRHSLAEKDVDRRRATCSVCGPVDIYPAGRGWVCMEKKRQAHADWASRNPSKAAANRRTKSAHTLTYVEGRGTEAKLADCVLCGSVTAVPWGRGWICQTRALELRKTQQSAPATRCIDCSVWLSPGQEPGRCPVCVKRNTPSESLADWDASGRRADIPSPVAKDIFTNEWHMWRAWDLSAPQRNSRSLLPVLGDPNVPPEWEWALNPKANWSGFDAQASQVSSGEGDDMQELRSDINGNPWSAQWEPAEPVTLPELYRKLRKPYQTFPEFKARFIAGVSPEELLLSRTLKRGEIWNMTNYPGYDNDELEDDYTIVD